ncbi:MAG: YbjQ family protein [Candidatus Hadarchaeota archaeon]
MIIVNTDFVIGREIKEVLGLVRGNTIRARGLGKDIKAAFRNIAGGKIDEYVEMLSESREEAINEMVERAE